MDDEFWNHVRQIAQEVSGARQFKGTLSCTAYNPATHAVKGIIQPHGIESGWIPVAAIHVGNGYGILVGPKVGSSDALDGDQFDLDFDLGDPNTLVARHKQFSTPDTPPMVQSGEILLQHVSGTKVFAAQDTSLTMLHGPTQSTIMIDKDGNHVHDAKDKSITITSSGAININGTISLNGG